MDNAVLIQNATLADLEAMVSRAVERRLSSFAAQLMRERNAPVRRKDAASLLGVSLPTLDAYAKCGLLHARHVGGKVFFDADELARFGKPSGNISPLPSSSHSHDTP